MGLGKDVDKYLTAINAILDAGGDVGSANEMINGLYETILSKYRPLLKTVPLIAEKVNGDLIPFMIEVHKFIGAWEQSQELIDAKLKYNKRRAQARKKVLDVYVEAGFTREEAIGFIMQDIVKSQLMGAKVSGFLTNAANKKK